MPRVVPAPHPDVNPVMLTGPGPCPSSCRRRYPASGSATRRCGGSTAWRSCWRWRSRFWGGAGLFPSSFRSSSAAAGRGSASPRSCTVRAGKRWRPFPPRFEPLPIDLNMFRGEAVGSPPEQPFPGANGSAGGGSEAFPRRHGLARRGRRHDHCAAAELRCHGGSSAASGDRGSGGSGIRLGTPFSSQGPGFGQCPARRVCARLPKWNVTVPARS